MIAKVILGTIFGIVSVQAATLTYQINGLAADSKSQSPLADADILATIIANPPEMASDFEAVFGEPVSRKKPEFSVGWDESNALGAVIWTDQTSANEDQFFAFAMKASAGNRLEITNLSFQWGSTQDGPRKLDVTMDVGNSSSGKSSETALDTYDLNTGSGNNPEGTSVNQSIVLSATTDVIIFRFYAYDANAAPGNGNNKGGFWDETGSNPIVITAEITPVPEPKAFGILLALGMVAGTAVRRRVR